MYPNLVRVFWVLVVTAVSGFAQTAPSADSKFLRFVDDGRGGGQLQASTVTYTNSAGVTVDLIAAVHIADASFFKELDDSFASYDSVLYELVKPRGSTFGGKRPAATTSTTQPVVVATTRPTTRRSGSLAWVGGLQRFMRDELKLSFQLEEIDYSRPNFVHADLDAETFEAMQEQKGESLMSLMLAEMIRQMAGDQPTGPQIGVLDLIAALQSPDRARSLKYLLGRQFGQIDELAAGFGDPDNTVIIGERNKAALRTLQQRIDAGDKKLAIFYGAAHLKSMEHTLETTMNFHQVGEPKWRTAWDIPDAPATQPVSNPLLPRATPSPAGAR